MPEARIRITFRDSLSGPASLRGDENEQRQQLLRTLSAIREIRMMMDDNELKSVRKARELDVSWTEIATAIGVTRQAAWERLHELDVTS